MNSRVLEIVAALFCLPIVMSCAIPGPRVPIINPHLIDQKAAKQQLIATYCDVVAKTERAGFEIGTAMCRRIQAGEIKSAGVKSSENGRYTVYMFKEKEDVGTSRGDYSIIAFSFNPGSEMIRSCNEAGLCDVHIKNGEARFGRSNASTQGEPMVNDSGVTIKFNEEPRSYGFDLLFSYRKSDSRQGDELITIFLSAYPFLYYQ